MAKRSDSAQKLLDDLRLRKEKMAAASQRSNQSPLPIDAYAYSKQTSIGSRKTKANEIVTSRTGDMLNRSSKSYRSAKNGEFSNQIVSYGRGQNSLKMNDVSLAIAFAFENGGKPRRADSSYNSSTMAFLHQIKRGTMEFSMMERQGSLVRQQASTNHFQALSPVQINEISKGAQKLNQILRACSNGFNIDRYSIEIAKDLFQGAIDLEQSLRMLVDLQQSSESMITPQKKNRIKLLDEDSDDDEDNKIVKVSEQNQLAPPIFSFDKPSRHTLMQGKIILTNSKEGRNSNIIKQGGKISKASQKQPTRSSSDIKNLNAISQQKKQSASAKSNTEKGRIPNVVAKLMGLDNIPEKVEPKHMPQKDSGNTQKIRGNHGMTFQHTAKESTRKAELNNKETENMVAMKKQKVIGAVNMPATQDEELVFGADKNLLMQKACSKVVVHNEKPLWSDLYGRKALKGFEDTTTKIDKQHNSAAQMIPISEGQKDVWRKGRKQEHAPANNTEQKGTVKGRTSDLTMNNMLSQLDQVNERSQVKPSLKEGKEINVSNVQLVRRHTNKQTTNNQKKSQNHLGDQKSYMLSNYGPQEEKHHREQRIQQREKQILQMRPQGGSELTSKISSKIQQRFVNSQKQQLNQATSVKQNFAENVEAMKLERILSSHYDDLVKHETSNDTNGEVKEIFNRKSGGIITMMDEKSVHKLANMKVKNTRKQKVDMPGKIDEVSNERNGRKLITKQEKQQIHILHESRQGTSDRFNVLKEAEGERVGMLKEADTCIISSNETVAVAESQDQRHHPPHKEAELPPTLYNPDGGELHILQEPVALAPSDLDQAASGVADEGFKTGEIALNTINGTHEDSMIISNHSQLQDQNISKKRIQEPLTESDNYLKRILVTSQSFLNTAEALFRLNIPFSIQQDGGQDDEGECRKLTLDCSYEVMKRKGILTELKVYPCSNISISTINIASLDDLVRQLNKDMEKLKFYGRNRSSQANVEDYLPKMLEHDVYSREPDIDCMWDSGWNEETFAFIEKCDVIKDMEKHVLNVLLDEITGELLHVQ